jgi:DNA-binding response OmpR family regulator
VNSAIFLSVVVFMRVLFVEDSERLQRSVSSGLRHSGYAVDIAGNGPEGLWYAQSNDYDVVVLDLMLPGMSGLDLLHKYREGGGLSHVLILTAKDTVEDRVKGLRQGADDYLVKPFDLDELLARVDALSRRRHGVKNPRIRLGELQMDTAARTVSRGSDLIDLTPREYALLEYLAVRPGQVVSRTEIESHLYDERSEPMSNVVDCAIYALRRKIDPSEGPSLIQTRRGMGYVLRVAKDE